MPLVWSGPVREGLRAAPGVVAVLQTADTVFHPCRDFLLTATVRPQPEFSPNSRYIQAFSLEFRANPNRTFRALKPNIPCAIKNNRVASKMPLVGGVLRLVGCSVL